jgi:hypothetical protein
LHRTTAYSVSAATYSSVLRTTYYVLRTDEPWCGAVLRRLCLTSAAATMAYDMKGECLRGSTPAAAAASSAAGLGTAATTWQGSCAMWARCACAADMCALHCFNWRVTCQLVWSQANQQPWARGKPLWCKWMLHCSRHVIVDKTQKFHICIPSLAAAVNANK